jgi:recombination protein RecA
VQQQDFIDQVNKVFGPYTLVPASDLIIPKRFTTGSLSLDVALGGGWPGNQWSEVIGEESSGKTATALKTLAANQRLDPEFTAIWIAAEIYDSAQATALGVDNGRVMVCPTQEMEFALELMLRATQSQVFDAVILDSYPALIPHEEDERAVEEVTVAAGAKVFNKYWRKAGKATKRATDGSERPVMGLIINQFRDKIGGFSKFGIPQTSLGGHGKDYAYFVRLKISKGAFITEKRPGFGDFVVGQEIKFKTMKNKSAAPQQDGEVDFYFRDAPILGYRRGDYDLGKEYVKVGIDFGVVAKSGGWLYFDDRKWNGRAALETDIRAEPELASTLSSQVLARVRDKHEYAHE